jgi:hypothetical protein
MRLSVILSVAAISGTAMWLGGCSGDQRPSENRPPGDAVTTAPSTASATTAAVQSRASRPDAKATSVALYEISDGKVLLPGWDDRPASAPPELMRLGTTDFEKPAFAYIGRVWIRRDPVFSIPVNVPAKATELVVFALGQDDLDVFPRIEVALVDAGDGASTSSSAARVLFTGNLVSRTLKEVVCKLPKDVPGRKYRVRIRQTDHPDETDQRRVDLAYVAFR